MRVSVGGRTASAGIVRDGQGIIVLGTEGTHLFRIPGAHGNAAAANEAGDAVLSPLPGLIKLVKVGAGQTVDPGDVLIVVETMKMEHPVAAHRGGRIAAVHAAEGEQVEEGMPLVELEPEDD